MRHFLRTTYLLTILLLCAASAHAGNLSGFGEWGYARFDGEIGGESVEATQFSQQYSLLYQTRGEVLGGRAGWYRGTVGGEWIFLDSDFDGESLDLETSKLLYRGELTIAPGGLPFRVRLFSHDLVRSRFSENRKELRGLDTEMHPGIRNGTHQTTGATMILGIRNGSYLGRYREILSQFPRFLMDYRQEVHRDLQGETPTHFRQRDLAFVSLNKKDNWFHFRYSDYTDYLDPGQDFSERKYMLGTIDHTLLRHWINLTNWIKVSVDGSFNSLQRDERDGAVEWYDLNLFAQARRNKWDAANFSSFEKGVDRQDSERVESWRRLNVPLFLKGEVDRDTSWKFSFIGSREEEATLSAGSDRREETEVLYSSARVETFRQRRYVVAAELEGEVTEVNTRKYYNAKLSGEFFSNRRYRPRVDLAGRYSLTYFGGESSDMEHAAHLRVSTDISSRLRTNLSQTFIFSTGSGGVPAADAITGRPGLRSSWRASDDYGAGDAFKSLTTWVVEHLTANNFSNRFALSYEYLRDEEETTEELLAKHSGLLQKSRKLIFRTETRLAVGDRIKGASSASGSLFTKGSFVDDSAGDTGTAVSHVTSLSYSPRSAWESGGEIGLDYENLPGRSTTTTWAAEQFSRYTFFKVNGIIRKLAELRQAVEYERFHYSDGTISGARISFEGYYYPVRGASLGFLSRYVRIFSSETESLENTFEAAWAFEKLALAFDYTYRTNSGEEPSDDFETHRWEFLIRKTL